MAHVTSVTIATGNKVSVNYQTEEAHVSVSYELGPGDNDLVAFVDTKAGEVEAAHAAIWRQIRAKRAELRQREAPAKPTEPTPPAARPQPVNEGSNHEEGEPPARPYQTNGDPGSSASSPASTLQRSEAAKRGPTTRRPPTPPPPAQPSPDTGEAITKPQAIAIGQLAKMCQLSSDDLTELIAERFARTALEELTKRQASQLLVELQNREQAQRQPVGAQAS